MGRGFISVVVAVGVLASVVVGIGVVSGRAVVWGRG